MSVEVGDRVAGESAAASESVAASDAAAASESLAASAPSRSAWLRLREWLGRRRSARTGATHESESVEARDLHVCARRALELARHALVSRGAADGSEGSVLAVQLFRQSIYWSLLLRSDLPARTDPERVFAHAELDLRARLGPRSDELIALLATFDFATFSEQAPESLRAIALDLELLASELVAEGQRSISHPQRRQTLAVALAFVAMGGLLVALTAGAMGMLSKPNLAQGKPWTTSSVYPDFDPVAKRCGGVSTAVFFCTNEDDNPWFEYDLGAPLKFSSLTILNRSDAVPERAVPLIVEISNDKKNYAEIARRTEVFDVWSPSFPPRSARYVRLRVPRKSFLHLDAVAVHP